MIALHEVINDFLFHCRVEKNLSTHTLKAYKLDLFQFNDYLSVNKKSKDIEMIDKHVLRAYLQRLIETNKSRR